MDLVFWIECIVVILFSTFLVSIILRFALRRWKRSNGFSNARVRDRLGSWREQFCSVRTLTVRVTTFNVAGLYPPSNSSALFRSLCCLEQGPDVVSLALQESDMTVLGVLLGLSSRHEAWEAAARAYLSTYDYDVVSCDALGTVFHLVAVHPLVSPLVSDVRTDGISTGFFSLIPNKATLVTRLSLGRTSVTLVDSHFKEGRSHSSYEERNATYQRIRQDRSLSELFDTSDLILWAGDLNYRLNIDRVEAGALLRGKHVDRLLEADQLREAMEARAAFVGFEEGQIQFLPTYKFDLQCDEEDCEGDSYVWKRVPSFTDRILWQCTEDEKKKVRLVSYDSLSGYEDWDLASDHRPVSAVIEIDISEAKDELSGEYLDRAKKEFDGIRQ